MHRYSSRLEPLCPWSLQSAFLRFDGDGILADVLPVGLLNASLPAPGNAIELRMTTVRIQR